MDPPFEPARGPFICSSLSNGVRRLVANQKAESHACRLPVDALVRIIGIKLYCSAKNAPEKTRTSIAVVVPDISDSQAAPLMADRLNVREDTKETKSKAGKRTIGLPPPLVVELERHHIEQHNEREQARDLWKDEGWIFADELGRKHNARTDQFHWKRLLDGAGVGDARLHDARHTAATVLLELGTTHRATMDLMGWSSTNMAKRYQHVTDPLR